MLLPETAQVVLEFARPKQGAGVREFCWGILWPSTRLARYREGGNNIHWITENHVLTGNIWNATNRLYGV